MGRRIAALLVFIAAAAVADDKPLVTLKLVKSGMMLLKTNNPGLYIPAPTVRIVEGRASRPQSPGVSPGD